MVIRPVVIAVTYFGLLSVSVFLILPTTVALTFNRNRMDDQRVHQIRNDMLERARDKENLPKRVGVYDPEIEPKQQVVIMEEGIDEDMAHFFKTLTKKRRGISQFENQALPDYSCEYTTVVEDYGAKVFPRKVEGKKCMSRSEQSSTCPPPFECQEMLYEVPFLRRTLKNDNDSVLKTLDKLSDLVPSRLRINWYAEYRNVSVGCQCAKTYTETISAK